jgi:hypothetical protein
MKVETFHPGPALTNYVHAIHIALSFALVHLVARTFCDQRS